MWYFAFATEYELSKFEHAIAEAWKERFQVSPTCLLSRDCFFLLLDMIIWSTLHPPQYLKQGVSVRTQFESLFMITSSTPYAMKFF